MRRRKGSLSNLLFSCICRCHMSVPTHDNLHMCILKKKKAVNSSIN